MNEAPTPEELLSKMINKDAEKEMAEAERVVNKLSLDFTAMIIPMLLARAFPDNKERMAVLDIVRLSCRSKGYNLDVVGFYSQRVYAASNEFETGMDEFKKSGKLNDMFGSKDSVEH